MFVLLEDLVQELRSLNGLGEDDTLVVLQLLQKAVQGFDLLSFGDLQVELSESVKCQLLLVVDKDLLRLLEVEAVPCA